MAAGEAAAAAAAASALAAAESGGGGGGGGGKLSTFNIFEYIICLFFFMLLHVDLAMVL